MKRAEENNIFPQDKTRVRAPGKDQFLAIHKRLFAAAWGIC